MDYIIVAIVIIVAIWWILGMSVLWAKGIDELACEAKKGSNEPGHYWDHLNEEDDA